MTAPVALFDGVFQTIQELLVFLVDCRIIPPLVRVFLPFFKVLFEPKNSRLTCVIIEEAIGFMSGGYTFCSVLLPFYACIPFAPKFFII